MTHQPIFLVIDLFCGFGGTTLGFELAKLEEMGIAKVIACVNHDPKAIQSHWLNHPEVKHYEEDIRTLDLTDLYAHVQNQLNRYPGSTLILWASLECTNFSKAKGGLPRDADSRTLAIHLYRYIAKLAPDYVMIENVVEFMSWGQSVRSEKIYRQFRRAARRQSMGRRIGKIATRLQPRKDSGMNKKIRQNKIPTV